MVRLAWPVSLVALCAALGSSRSQAQRVPTPSTVGACGASSVGACASSAVAEVPSGKAAQNKADDTAEPGSGVQPIAPGIPLTADEVPAQAQLLLLSRFPYLTAAQRSEVLATTSRPSGDPLRGGGNDDDRGRLDFSAAYNGFGAFNAQTAITMNAALGGHNAADTYANSIGGAGGLTLFGTGILTLTGTDTYSGPTFVKSGTLQVSGSITSATTVYAGGTLAGAGTVGSVTVNNGGTLAPGSLAAIGTLNVAGPLVFASGATYAVRAMPTEADNTVVKGAATLGGTVEVAAGGGPFLPRTRYAIVTADGGIGGGFGGVTTNLAFLNPSLSYDSHDAYLNLSRNDVSFTAVAATGNQRGVGTALTSVGSRPTNDAGSAILNSLFTLSAAGARGAYDQISGEGLVASQTTNIRAGRAFSETINDQISLWRVRPTAGAPIAELADLPSRPSAAAPPSVQHYRVWVSGSGGAFDINGNTGLGTARQTGDFYGGDVGADTEVQPGLLLGGSLGGSGTDFAVNQRASSGSAVGFHASIYGAFTSGANYLQSITSFSDFSNTTNRNVGGFGGFGVAAERASFGSTEIRERLEAGHSISRDAGFGTPEVRFTPFVALEIARLATNGFNEYATNGVANVYGLQSFGQSVADVPGFVGFRADGVTKFGGFAIRPVVSLAYLHEFAPQRNLANGFISLPGSTFLVQGARAARNAAQTKIGAETSLSGGLSVFADFEGEFSGDEQVYGGKGGLRYVW